MYSETQLEFIRKLAAAYSVPQRRYHDADIRILADLMLKQAAWNNWQDWKNWGSDLGKGALNVVGDGGWAWDTGQNAAGNLSGYGGMIGSILGSTGGAVAGSAALPGVGTAAGGVAGGVAGGAAGRGLGYALGSGIDWFMGNKPGESQVKQVQNADGTVSQVAPSFLNTTFNPGAMLGDGGFGLLPGAGKGLQYLGRGLTNTGAKAALRSYAARSAGKALPQKVLEQSAEKGLRRLGGSWGVAKTLAARERNEAMKRMGMKAYQAPAGSTLMQQIPGRFKNFAQNMGRTVSTGAGRQALGREGLNLAKWGIPLSMAGNAAAQTSIGSLGRQHNPFTNTQGFTQVVSNKDRGLSGVQAMTPDAYRSS